MVLRGTRCIVRRWRASDADALVRHANNANIAKHLRDRFPHPYTADDARTFLLYVTKHDTEATNLAIEVEGQAAGAIGLSTGSDVERYSAEIGYWLGEAYWGRGVVSEALALVTERAFERLDLLRLFALPFADNAASVRVLEKAGYVREGILRSSAVKYGQPRDQFLYARVNPRWRGAASQGTADVS
jgi:RimJ/RimL family protein N-acetyltransferase